MPLKVFVCSGNSIGEVTSLKCPPEICRPDLLLRVVAASRRGASLAAGKTELVVSIIAEVYSIGFKIAMPKPPLVDVTLGSW